MTATIIGIALTVLQAVPGFASTVKTLIDDIKGHPDLTQAEKDKLVAQAKLDVDAEDARVQSVP